MNYSKRILLFLLGISTIVIADNHDINVSGTVFVYETNIPLQGANIVFKSTEGVEHGSSSDSNGKFTISDVSSGEYTVLISFIGYEDYKESIIFEKGNSYQVDAFLAIKPILMAKLEILSEVDEPYQDLPGSATVFGMQTIKLINPVGTQEMLEYVPGINGFADDGIGNSRISIGIRGLNPRRSSRVLILEDGVPIQPALYVYPNMYYNPPADRIDRIEVIKGSGSILYGPQTMGGVINYFTKRPRNDFGGIFKVTVGENGYNSIFTEIGGWNLGRLRPEIQLLFKKGDGFRQNNGFEQFNGTMKLNYKKSEVQNIYLKANVNYENSNATYTGLTKFMFDNDPTFNPKKDDNFEVFRAALDYINTEKLSTNISKRLIAYASFFDRRWWRETDMFVNAELDSATGDVTLESSPKGWYFANVPGYNLVRTGNRNDNFGILRTFYVLGLENSYQINHNIFSLPSKMELGWRVYWERFIDDRKTGFVAVYDSTTGLVDSVFAPDARDGVYFRGAGEDLEILGTSHHYETLALSGFFSESIDFGFIRVRPGLRFEIFEQERVDRLQGSLYQDKTILVALPGIGFTTKFNDMTLFGGVHRGFTPPSSGALKILNFGEGLEEDSGLDLDAEKSWNREIGLRKSRGLLNFELSFFNNDIENLVAAGRGTAFSNLGKVNARGHEIQVSAMLSDIMQLLPNFHVSYTGLQTKIKDATISSGDNNIDLSGNELPYSPKTTYTIGIEYQLFSKIALRIDQRFVSEVYTDFENLEVGDNEIGDILGISGPVPDYRLLNASGSVQITNRFKIFFSGKNITDEIYIGSRLHSNPNQPDPEISSGILPGPRRQWNLGLEYTL